MTMSLEQPQDRACILVGQSLKPAPSLAFRDVNTDGAGNGICIRRKKASDVSNDEFQG